MKKFIVILVAIISLSCSLLYSQTGWFQQNSGITESFSTVYFLNDQTGFAGSGLRVYKTTNGGTSWTPKVLPDTTTIYSIRFLNSATGFACGGRYLNPYESYQQLFKTTNTGENWTKIFQESGLMTSENFLDVFPVDSLIYLACGGTGSMSTVGSLYISTNTGASFMGSSFGDGSRVEKLSFTNSQTGWVSTTYGTDVPFSMRKIFKTTNHGLNWIMQYRDSAMQTSFSSQDFEMQFVNQSTGYGLYHKMNSVVKFLKSTNGGTTFDSTSLPYAKYKSMFFADASTGWICDGYYPDSVLIIRTTNSGSNWHVQKKGNLSLNAIYFINNLTGWAVGFGGVILKTITGGVTGVQNISKEVPSTYSLGQNYPNPFNSSSKFKFEISKLGSVKIVIYDIQGRDVQTLVNERLQPGTYETTFDGSMLTSGVYFYKLSAGDFTETKRMLLIK